jgi:MFS family permease
LVGVGIALIATSVTALIADFYQGDSRSRFMGLQAALMGIGGVFFLAGGGLLAELGWRPPFLLHLIALVFVVPVLFVLWRSERVSEPGAADDARMPWGDVAFLTMAVFAGMGGFYILLVQVPFKLDLLSISPTLSGVAIALSTLVGVFTSLAYAPLKRRFHYSTILSVTFLCIGIGMAVTGYSSSFAGVQGGLLIVGLGIGLIMANCTVWLTSKVPAPLRGRAVGIFMTGLFLGQFLMPLASQLLVADFGLTRVLTSFGGALALLGLAVLKRR